MNTDTKTDICAAEAKIDNAISPMPKTAKTQRVRIASLLRLSLADFDGPCRTDFSPLKRG